MSIVIGRLSFLLSEFRHIRVRTPISIYINRSCLVPLSYIFRIAVRRTLPIGEKLWEDTGKVMRRSIKATHNDTATIELDTEGEFKGFGRARGIDRHYIATGIVLRGPGNVRGASFQEMFTTAGETIIINGNQLTKLDGGKSKGFSLLTFTTTSEKISWVNDLILVREGYNDPVSDQFSGSIYEWK